MKLLRHSLVQARIGIPKIIRTGRLNSFSLKAVLEPDRMMDSKSAFEAEEGGRVLGIASNC